ncbi:MAG: hypothetical protein ACYTGX_08330 [Planctomycetota bacterium]|jgi:hypothetical protein
MSVTTLPTITTRARTRTSLSNRRAGMRRKIWLLRLQEQDRMLEQWRGQLGWLIESGRATLPSKTRRALISVRMAQAGIRAAIDELQDGAPPTEWVWRSAVPGFHAEDDELFKVLCAA